MKILLVEDEPSLREEVAEILRMFNYDVQTAADGQYAWEQLDAYQPGIVITDIKMPRMSGIELLEKIRASKHKNLPVIITSAYANSKFIETTSRLGISAYVTKPFSLTDLTESVERAFSTSA